MLGGERKEGEGDGKVEPNRLTATPPPASTPTGSNANISPARPNAVSNLIKSSPGSSSYSSALKKSASSPSFKTGGSNLQSPNFSQNYHRHSNNRKDASSSKQYTASSASKLPTSKAANSGIKDGNPSASSQPPSSSSVSSLIKQYETKQGDQSPRLVGSRKGYAAPTAASIASSTTVARLRSKEAESSTSTTEVPALTNRKVAAQSGSSRSSSPASNSNSSVRSQSPSSVNPRNTSKSRLGTSKSSTHLGYSASKSSTQSIEHHTNHDGPLIQTKPEADVRATARSTQPKQPVKSSPSRRTPEAAFVRSTSQTRNQAIGSDTAARNRSPASRQVRTKSPAHPLKNIQQQDMERSRLPGSPPLGAGSSRSSSASRKPNTTPSKTSASYSSTSISKYGPATTSSTTVTRNAETTKASAKPTVAPAAEPSSDVTAVIVPNFKFPAPAVPLPSTDVKAIIVPDFKFPAPPPTQQETTAKVVNEIKFPATPVKADGPTAIIVPDFKFPPEPAAKPDAPPTPKLPSTLETPPLTPIVTKISEPSQKAPGGSTSKSSSIADSAVSLQPHDESAESILKTLGIFVPASEALKIVNNAGKPEPPMGATTKYKAPLGTIATASVSSSNLGSVAEEDEEEEERKLKETAKAVANAAASATDQDDAYSIKKQSSFSLLSRAIMGVGSMVSAKKTSTETPRQLMRPPSPSPISAAAAAPSSPVAPHTDSQQQQQQQQQQQSQQQMSTSPTKASMGRNSFKMFFTKAATPTSPTNSLSTRRSRTSLIDAVPAAPPPAPPSPPAERKLQLSDFKIKRTLGTGSFGRVHLALLQEHAGVPARHVALKVLRKTDVIKLKQVEHTIDERKILGELAARDSKTGQRVCPFVVELVGTFKDTTHLYLCLEYVPGGELFSLLRKMERFKEGVARFYAAEVVLAFKFLHERGIIYRDLKPENILLDAKGHIKITDFGFAKHIDNGTTWTLCGTPDYLAPEIIKSKGYSKAVDWWALGILIYEMVAGHPPFFDDDPFKLYEKILACRLAFPPFMQPLTRDLCRKLLTPDLSKRYGNLRGGATDVMQHPWFEGIPWERLHELPAPHVPALKGQGDTSQFDVYDEDYEPYGTASASSANQSDPNDLFAQF